MQKDKKAVLILEDGTKFEGFSFGSESSRAGEVVFNTAMTGYPESLTDPSYRGQLLVLTYPLVGNYGVPEMNYRDELPEFFESESIHISGLIISDYSSSYNHWNASKSLGDWLKENNVPGIYGIDTRALTKILREKGSMLGKIVIDEQDVELFDPNGTNLVAEVSIKDKKVYGSGAHRILLIDCGVKTNIIRQLLRLNCTVLRVPWDYDFRNENFDGLFITNGPGDPMQCTATIENLKSALQHDNPIFGICLGNQLMSLAAGAKTYKLKYGHRSHNQPALLKGTKRAFITSQNHGFAVDGNTLPDDWEELFVNLNDGSNEGIKHKTKPFFSSQFHPEASGGPTDTEFLFDMFIEQVEKYKSSNSAGTLSFGFQSDDIKIEEKEIKKVLLLGSGALKIGEAGEFDYSGSQALKALREENIKTVLINPNIATVQTSEKVADIIYFLPVTPYFVERVIQKEKPDGVMLSFGGQTALNCGIKMFEEGTFEKYGVKVLGTPMRAVLETEDRELFVNKLAEINVKVPRSLACGTWEEAVKAADELHYPVIIRAGFALGGLGSGFCSNENELLSLADKAFAYSPQILVEESLKGWKEIEYEVVRDKYDNCITVCNMENFDPLGIHTGESIVVAPSQTLTNREYHNLRKLAIKIIRHIGIVGECNIQYALDPNSEEYRVIEVNARLSRSSALASKATGYPLAFIAAKLALGYGLPELKNSITKSTSAFFEPALDYIVCKIPRWDLNKFRGVSKNIGSSMKSVGEVMAIGRSFEEAIQKGLRMIGQGMHGFVGNKDLEVLDYEKELSQPTDMRIFVIAMAFSNGLSVEHIYELTKIDRWFLEKLKIIFDIRTELLSFNNLDLLPDELFRFAKQKGFSDFQIGRFVSKSRDYNMEEIVNSVREKRKKRNIIPYIKQIDTLAGEYPAQTNYLYITYNGFENDISPERDGKSIIVLGSGAYRIGSSVEFDWCSVNASNTIKSNGLRSVMINYNPETVSTDYDICDKLYFDELTFERVMDIIDFESPRGVVVSMGGQIPNNLAMKLFNQGVNILGTSPHSIDMAENRHKFSNLLDGLGIDQPEWKELTDISEIMKFAEKVGYPLLVRPSYVLSGASMNIVSNPGEMEKFLTLAAEVSKQYPVVVSKFIEDAKEIEMDAVAGNNGEIIAYAISEHVEFAGVHSGDATMLFPPQKVYVETTRKIKKISAKIAQELKINGPFNIQFLARDNDIKVIECNLRASRSFPFVSKVLKTNFIELATNIMLGNKVEKPNKSLFDLDYIGVKAPQFSFSRLHSADPVLGVEMASTGEVGCLGENYYEAILSAMLSVGYSIPKKNILISSGPLRSKVEMVNSVKMLLESGFNVYTTYGTYEFLKNAGIETLVIERTDFNSNDNIVEMINLRKFDMIINIPRELSAKELEKDYAIRRAAVDRNIPLITNSRLASAFIYSICKMKLDEIAINSWNEM